jgi:hypothetical protein
MLAAALATFFASGFAALLYQVIWQRVLVTFSGTDVHAATIVVAAFMPASDAAVWRTPRRRLSGVPHIVGVGA